MNERKIVVSNSPWPSKLPNGTLIKDTSARPGKEGEWFERVDGLSLFPDEEPDNKFKLFSNEYEVIK